VVSFFADKKIIISLRTGVKCEAEWQGVKIASRKNKDDAVMILKI